MTIRDILDVAEEAIHEGGSKRPNQVGWWPNFQWWLAVASSIVLAVDGGNTLTGRRGLKLPQIILIISVWHVNC